MTKKVQNMDSEEKPELSECIELSKVVPLRYNTRKG